MSHFFCNIEKIQLERDTRFDMLTFTTKPLEPDNNSMEFTMYFDKGLALENLEKYYPHLSELVTDVTEESTETEAVETRNILAGLPEASLDLIETQLKEERENRALANQILNQNDTILNEVFGDNS